MYIPHTKLSPSLFSRSKLPPFSYTITPCLLFYSYSRTKHSIYLAPNSLLFPSLHLSLYSALTECSSQERSSGNPVAHDAESYSLWRFVQ